MHGTPFVQSGKQAVKLLTLNICNTITINSIGDFVLTMSYVLVTVVSALIAYLMLPVSIRYPTRDLFRVRGERWRHFRTDFRAIAYVLMIKPHLLFVTRTNVLAIDFVYEKCSFISSRSLLIDSFIVSEPTTPDHVLVYWFRYRSFCDLLLCHSGNF